MRLVIKGDRVKAFDSATARGFEALEFKASVFGGEATVLTGTHYDGAAAARWFAKTAGLAAPFALGTLLHFGYTQGEE